MVWDTVREAPFGQLVRFLTSNRVFQYPEEKDLEVWYSYINTVKSSNLALYGSLNPDPADVAPPPFITQAHQSHAQVDEVPLDELIAPRPPLPGNGNESRDTLATQVDPYEQGRKSEKKEINYEKDALLIDWAENDPAVRIRVFAMSIVFGLIGLLQNPFNWSLAKRCFVTGLIALLTVSIYIGSAIYSPGIPDVMIAFGISQTAATLGLTLFIL